MLDRTRRNSAQPALPLNSEGGSIKSVTARDPLGGDRLAGTESGLSAQMYYQAGKNQINADRHGDALEYFQKSLTCIPNILGVTPEYSRYLFDGQQPACTDDFVSAIYEGLATCLYRQKRFEDSWLAARAALVCDPANINADKLAYCLISDLQKAQQNRMLSNPYKYVQVSPTLSDIEPKLTLLMVTNFTEKLKKFAHLSPPGSGLVETTYKSILQVLGKRLSRCKKILCYDRNHPSAEHENAYQKHLKNFARDHHFDFHVVVGFGLQKVMQTLLPTVKTPYLLFLEHDWEFQGPEIDLKKLLDVFDRHPLVNYVRFNKRKNIISNFDFILETETFMRDVNLIRTVAHSNNPHLVRVEKLRNDWLPICLQDPFCQKMDLSGKAFGIENPLFKRHMQDIRKMGFARAQEIWGTYIYGQIGDPPRIKHLGE